jgi:hypothetical protein
VGRGRRPATSPLGRIWAVSRTPRRWLSPPRPSRQRPGSYGYTSLPSPGHARTACRPGPYICASAAPKHERPHLPWSVMTEVCGSSPSCGSGCSCLAWGEITASAAWIGSTPLIGRHNQDRLGIALRSLPRSGSGGITRRHRRCDLLGRSGFSLHKGLSRLGPSRPRSVGRGAHGRQAIGCRVLEGWTASRSLSQAALRGDAVPGRCL